jgi:hypothetical protein
LLFLGSGGGSSIFTTMAKATQTVRGLMDELERKICDLESELKELKCDMALVGARHNLKERLLEFYDKHGREDKKAHIDEILDELRFTSIATAHGILDQKYRDSIWSSDAMGRKGRIGIAPGHTRTMSCMWWWWDGPIVLE